MSETDPYAKDIAAFRKIIYQLGDVDVEEADILEATDAVLERMARMQERIDELERLVDPDPGTKDYESLTKAEKVRKVRSAVYRKAKKQTGAAQMTYDEILALFENHPSPGHAYDLMERAGEMDGFEYGNSGPNGNGKKRLAVKTDVVKNETDFHAVNKEERSKAVA